jgi:hypothetical protein
MPRQTRAVRLPPPPPQTGNPAVQTWLANVHSRVGDGPFLVQGYNRANVPPADEWANLTSPNYFSSLIFVIDAGGATPMLAFSNGTDWIRVDTGAAI